MASSRSWTNICQECGRHVEILNGDFEFSMDLHKQSHKSLEAVNKQFGNTQHKIENTARLYKNYCNDCNEYIEIVNNDTRFSLQLHALKHKSGNTDTLSAHSSSSSGNGTFQNIHKNREEALTKPVLTSILDGIFHTMPIGLKAHREFISESSCNRASCDLCEIIIEPIFSVKEHLKTKLHEDNTILVIKTLIPTDLQDQMEFVSFYGSNLYCNLCSCKIDLCSNNLHETVVNIFAHNAGKGHICKKSNKNDSNQSDKPLIILKTLALMDPVVNENQDLIEYKMNPYFKCNVCNKVIAHSENEKELLNHFKCHFNSPGHEMSVCTRSKSLLSKWNDLNVTGKENHKFVEAKQNIYCLACSSFVDANLEQLLAHVREKSALSGGNQFDPLHEIKFPNPSIAPIDQCSSFLREKNVQNGKSSSQEAKPMPGEQLPSRSINLTEKKGDVKANFNELLKTNITIKWNAKYLENEEETYKCKLCKKITLCGNNLKLLEENIMSHITGKKHKKNLDKEFNNMLDKVQLCIADIQTNRNFLMRKDDKVCCTLCNCVVCATPLEDRVDGFIQNLLIHLRGSGHYKKKTATVCNSSTSGNPCKSEKTLPQNVIKESFDKLPKSYLNDTEFISISPIEGYLSCSVCNATIHPRYLKEHLENLQHVQRKVVSRVIT